MADMPILSGLVGQQGAGAPPGGPAITFDDLTPEQFEALQQEAAAAAQGVSADEGEMVDALEEGEGGEEVAEAAGAIDPTEPAEEPTEEELAEQAAAEAQQVADLATALAGEIAGYRKQAEALVDAAGEAEDGDPKKVKKAVKELTSIEKDVEKALKKVTAAAEDGDPEDAQKAYEEVEQLGQDALELFQEAQEAAGAPAGASSPAPGQSAAGAKPGPAAAPPAAPSPAKSPLEVWAGR